MSLVEKHRDAIGLIQDDVRALVFEVASALRSPPPRAASDLQNCLRIIDSKLIKLDQLLLEAARVSGRQDQPVEHEEQRKLALFLAELNQIRSTRYQWHPVREMVEQQLEELRVPLIRERNSRPTARDISEALADDLFNILHKATTRRDQDVLSLESGAFADIGLQNSVFAELMHATYRLRLVLEPKSPTRFLDVGCGVGTKVLGASRFFSHVTGLELDRGYVSDARELMKKAGLLEAKIVHANALDYENYSEFDVVYFFRPIEDHEKLLELEKRIVEKVSKGAILIAPYLGFSERHTNYDCCKLVDRVFIKGLAAREARQLKRLSEYTGLSVNPPLDPLSGIWDPVVSVSNTNGFDVFRRGRLDGV